MEDKLLFYKNCFNSGVRLSCHYKPATSHEILKNKKNRFEIFNAEKYYLESFTIPSSFDMEIRELDEVLKIISKVAKEISKN